MSTLAHENGRLALMSFSEDDCTDCQQSNALSGLHGRRAASRHAFLVLRNGARNLVQGPWLSKVLFADTDAAPLSMLFNVMPSLEGYAGRVQAPPGMHGGNFACADTCAVAENC